MNRESNICNSYKKYNFGLGIFMQNCCQPLREAVSWNASSVSLIYVFPVSLFVRLWVEMSPYLRDIAGGITSASSWGCELKCQCLDAASRALCQPLREAVSWNICRRRFDENACCQPLREAVSWNITCFPYPRIVATSASSWGCELKYPLGSEPFFLPLRQPLREAVSWNIVLLQQNKIPGIGQPLREAVSWNKRGGK